MPIVEPGEQGQVALLQELNRMYQEDLHFGIDLEGDETPSLNAYVALGLWFILHDCVVREMEAVQFGLREPPFTLDTLQSWLVDSISDFETFRVNIVKRLRIISDQMAARQRIDDYENFRALANVIESPSG